MQDCAECEFHSCTDGCPQTELVAENKALREALEKIIPILGDVDQSHWPAPQHEAQTIAQQALLKTGGE